MSSIAVDLPSTSSFGPRTLALFERARKQHLPIAAGIELTHRCNLACLHCYVNLPAADRDDIPRIRKWAQDEGLKFRFDTVLSPRIDGGKQPLAQRLSPEEAVALEAGDENRQTEFTEFCHSYGQTPQVDDAKYHCGAG